MVQHSSDQRMHAIARVLGLILVLNLVVATAKLVYGLRTGSLAILADGLHSLLDGSSNVVGLVGISIARRPPDANHPYGHRKYETVAALGIAAILFYGCQEIAGEALARLRHPTPPTITAVGIAIMLLTLAINLIVVRIERREARRLHSELLLSDLEHTRSDVYATLLVLASFVAQRFRVGWADVAAAAIILVLILRSGVEILRRTLPTLSDERRIDPAAVEETVLREPGVFEAHNVRSRGLPDDIHVDLHILVHPSTPLAEAHAVGHRVERRLRERFQGLSDIVVHVEPALDSERARVREGGGLKAEG